MAGSPVGEDGGGEIALAQGLRPEAGPGAAADCGNGRKSAILPERAPGTLRWAWMARAFHRRLVCLLVLSATAVDNAACTLVKPVVGVVMGPVVILRDGQCRFGEWEGEARGEGYGEGAAVLVGLVVFPVAGVIGGLVTGVVSDFHVLRGQATDPGRNWSNPFATNTMAETR